MATNNYKVKLAILIVIFAAIFAAIAVGVAEGKTMAFDIELSKTIYSLRTSILTKILLAVSSVSSTPSTGALTAVVIIAFLIKKRRKIAVFFGATLLVSVAFNNIAKYSVHRFRPDIAPLEEASFYSFPSGHSMNSLVFYGLLLYIAHRFIKNKKLLAALNAAAIIFVALVGFSRVYLGAHYPTDVIAGFCAGACVLVAAAAIEKTGKFKKYFSAE